MILDVRGGLGTQLLELMGGYALAIEHGHTIHQIVVNCGGESNDGAGNVLRDYISELFVRLPAPVIVTKGPRKLGVFKDKTVLPLVIKHRKQLRSTLGSLAFHGTAPRLPVMHVRRGDYAWVALDRYIDYAKAHEVCLIGNISADTGQVPGFDISGGKDPIKDWFSGYYAPEIIGTASSFIVSMLFMNPEKRVKMFLGQEGAVFEEIMGPVMRRFERHFPNVNWIE